MPPRGDDTIRLLRRQVELGRERRQLGKAGEGLFEFLAANVWGADFVRTGESQGSDGYLEWPDLRGIRLPVQVKTARALRSRDGFYRWSVKAQKLRGWAAQRPLLVLCIAAEMKAWWLDTSKQHLLTRPTKAQTFDFPLTQSVDISSRHVVRALALRQPWLRPPFVITASKTKPSFVSVRSIPKALRRLSSGAIVDVVRDTYRAMEGMSVRDRDVRALAVARLVHANLLSSGDIRLEVFLDDVTNQLRSQFLGGRSFTLGALISLLHVGTHNQVDLGSVAKLEQAAEAAIIRGTFLNPEFGLLIAALLCQQRPTQSHLSDLVRQLVITVIDKPQNPSVKKIATKVNNWLAYRSKPLDRVFSRQWVTRQIIRPLPQDADVLVRPQEAEAAFEKGLVTGPSGATEQELKFIDQLIRLEASYVLEEWLPQLVSVRGK